MFHCFSLNLDTLVNFFSTHQNITHLFVFLISFLESMVVIGLIMPGALTMPAIGFLIGTSAIPAGITFLWSSLGAMLGDLISYWIGIYFKDSVCRIWPFTKWPKLLIRSRAFFAKHGGKSVFICRFIGPMRAMVPMIAGACKLSLIRFIGASIPAAFLWSIVYMMPGVLLGALSAELPPAMATKLIAGALAVVVIIWLFTWLIRHTFKQFKSLATSRIASLWGYLRSHANLKRLANSITDPNNPDNHQQLTLVISIVLLLIIFLWIIQQVINPGFFFEFSRKIYHLLSSIRVKWLDNILVLVTFLGDLSFLLLLSSVILIILLQKKLWSSAIHWFFLVVISGCITKILKILIHTSRPGEVSYDLQASSFPSAHVALSTAIYGFLAIVIAQGKDDKEKQLIYITTALLVGLIGFSRIYLGVHWFCDIVGGVVIGTIMMLIAVVLQNRQRKTICYFKPINATATIMLLALLWLGFSTINFNRQLKNYRLSWPRYSIKTSSLIKGNLKILPAYRINRLGKPIEAMNLIYIGNLEKLKQILLERGWEIQKSRMDFRNFIKSISPSSVSNHLPILSQLYHNRKLSLLLTKAGRKHDELLILRVWTSDIDLSDSEQLVWMGDVEKHQARSKIFSWNYPKNSTTFVGATESLSDDLKKDFRIRSKFYPHNKFEPIGLNWDRKLIIVEE